METEKVDSGKHVFLSRFLRVLRFVIYGVTLFMVLTSRDTQTTWPLFSYLFGTAWILSLLLTVILDNTFFEKVFGFIEIFVVITILWGAQSIGFDKLSMLAVVIVYNIGLLIARKSMVDKKNPKK